LIRRVEEHGVVSNEAESVIATEAEKPADLAGAVVVVYVKGDLLGRTPTDRAHTALGREEFFIGLHRHTERATQMIGTLLAHASLTNPRLRFPISLGIGLSPGLSSRDLIPAMSKVIGVPDGLRAVLAFGTVSVGGPARLVVLAQRLRLTALLALLH
jgi:hypothetical protein